MAYAKRGWSAKDLPFKAEHIFPSTAIIVTYRYLEWEAGWRVIANLL